MTKHAILRAKERYNLDLTFDDLRKILDNILEGNARFKICKHSECKTYRVRYKGILLEPVVSENYKIVTFNPITQKKRTDSRDWMYKQKRLRMKKCY